MTPRVAIIVFPGTWSDRDFLDVAPLVGWEALKVWHADGELPAVDAVVIETDKLDVDEVVDAILRHVKEQ